MRTSLAITAVAIAATLPACQPAQQASPPGWTDPSAHRVSFITVAPDVTLEVLDWGGSGPSLVFLAGLGNTAHAYDDFAPRFVDSYRVVAITRRGFGASSHPDSGYDAGTLANDVLGVLASMQLDNAILAGHSIAAIELTAIGSRHADRVRRLIYLDTYCSVPQADSLWRAMSESPPTGLAVPEVPTDADTLTVEGYVSFVHRTRGVDIPEADIRARYAADGWNEALGTPYQAVLGTAMGGSYTCADVKVPALTVIARRDSVSQEEPYIRADTAAWPAQHVVQRMNGELARLMLDQFPRVIPSGRAEVIPGGHHWVFVSHADDVERLIRDFLQAR
jgi:pimeloyl-ACP methyl ester carboxylesterase